MSMIGYLMRVTQSELDEFLNDSSLLETKIEEVIDSDQIVDIDKSWDGIVYLLTGAGVATAEGPLLKVLFSGQLIDAEQDLGYGPAHYLTASQVSLLSDEISRISAEDLRLRFNAEEMNRLEVYPAIWDDDKDTFTYLADNFESVKAVYADAAERGEAIITFLS